MIFFSCQVSERFGAVVAEQTGGDLSEILNKLRLLYVLTVVERNLGWFLSNEMLTPEMGKEVPVVAAELCAEIGPHSLALTDAFAFTDQMLSAPIAQDWVKYNTVDNQGEVREDAM